MFIYMNITVGVCNCACVRVERERIILYGMLPSHTRLNRDIYLTSMARAKFNKPFYH